MSDKRSVAARRVAKALGYEASKASDLGIYSKGEYISPDSIGRIAALLDERDELRLALTAIGDKAVVDWDDETVGQVDAVISKPEGKRKETYIEWFRKAMARAEEFDALYNENAQLREKLGATQIRGKVVDYSLPRTKEAELRAELDAAKVERDNFQKICANTGAAIGLIIDYHHRLMGGDIQDLREYFYKSAIDGLVADMLEKLAKVCEMRDSVKQERDAANRECGRLARVALDQSAELAEAKAENERLRAALEALIRAAMPVHNNHWDSTMQHGAGCPQCQIEREACEAARKALEARP